MQVLGLTASGRRVKGDLQVMKMFENLSIALRNQRNLNETFSKSSGKFRSST